jgi:hypothetical protein
VVRLALSLGHPRPYGNSEAKQEEKNSGCLNWQTN